MVTGDNSQVVPMEVRQNNVQPLLSVTETLVLLP